MLRMNRALTVVAGLAMAAQGLAFSEPLYLAAASSALEPTEMSDVALDPEATAIAREYGMTLQEARRRLVLQEKFDVLERIYASRYENLAATWSNQDGESPQ